MKLKTPNNFTGTVNSGGQSFTPDANGIVDIPDNQINSQLWGLGFTAYVEPVTTVEKPTVVTAQVSASTQPTASTDLSAAATNK